MYKLEQFFNKSNTGKAAFQAVTSKLSLMNTSSIWVTVVSLGWNTTTCKNCQQKRTIILDVEGMVILKKHSFWS